LDTWVWIIIIAVIAVVAVAALAVFAIMQGQRRRTEELREGFGPEYDRAVEEFGSRKAAESQLRERQERIERLRLRALSPDERARFHERWTSTQARFVDEPAAAVGEANSLVDEAMKARGYPVADGDFDERAADVSVEHPYVVENYRAARRIAVANENGDATTEDLRQGMVHYRALFTELLNAGGGVPERDDGSADRDEPRERVSRTGRRPDRMRRASS
jgi:hypothetical protein